MVTLASRVVLPVLFVARIRTIEHLFANAALEVGSLFRTCVTRHHLPFFIIKGRTFQVHYSTYVEYLDNTGLKTFIHKIDTVTLRMT